MKKPFYIIYLITIMFFSVGYVFPDKLPDWKKVPSYLPEKLEFQKTTLDEFRREHPGAKAYDVDENIQIISTTPIKEELFKEVFVGFKGGLLEWVEFILKKDIEVNKFVTLYGFPSSIDTEYNEELDYYNYKTFNVSTDKDHNKAKSITIFAISEVAQQDKRNLEIPVAERKTFFEMFPRLKPGIITEDEFKKQYPALLPYMESKYDINTTYTMIEELKGARYYYKKAVLKFENGLLSWISLEPITTELKIILKNIKDPYKKEKFDENTDFYKFANFIFVVDKLQAKVNYIGITGYDKRF